MEIETLIKKIETFNSEEIPLLMRAYEYSKNAHRNQFRDSGVPYIEHLKAVADILASQEADGASMAAGFLHDTLEDDPYTNYDILVELFGVEIASLVYGVTKLSKLDFSSKEERDAANIRKLILAMRKDIRVVIIKLADRLHNMRTIGSKTVFKQKENAIETMELFVPLAYFIGEYDVKTELEDLSFKCIAPDEYKRLEEQKLIIEEKNNDLLLEMMYKIGKLLEDKDIPYEIKYHIKNIYGIYKRLESGHNIDNIHDLLSMKIIVNTINECFEVFREIQKLYPYINNTYKNYIDRPKTNLYQSLHLTLMPSNANLVQTLIRTFEMDRIASNGLTAYWHIHREKARELMQETFKTKLPFYKSLGEIDELLINDSEFVNQAKEEVFSGTIYVDYNGIIIELPKGSTIIDLAYKLGNDYAEKLICAFVNEQRVDVSQVLKNKDRISLALGIESLGPSEEWLGFVKTIGAKAKIKDYIRSRK